MYSVSIIITLDEQQAELRRLLPAVLSMPCEHEYEVIVVDKLHDKDLGEWLRDMEASYPHLSHTFCSTTARGIDTHRLALTLGAKAAAYDWLAVLPAHVKPGDGDWLRRLTDAVDDGTDAVISLAGSRLRWQRFVAGILRRRLSLFRLPSSVMLCRRGLLLGDAAVKPSRCKLVKL